MNSFIIAMPILLNVKSWNDSKYCGRAAKYKRCANRNVVLVE